MKRISTVLLMCIIGNYSLVAMNIITRTQSDKGLDEIVAVMDKAINEEHSSRPHFLISMTPRPHYLRSLYAAVCSIPRKCYPSIILTKKLLDKLHKKNTVFAEAISFFSSKISDNFSTVSPETINTIDSPEIFTQLLIGYDTKFVDQAIISFIIELAKKNTTYEYQMYLPVGADIIDFDICPATDRTIISSGDKRPYTLCLWDLKTVTPLHTFEEEKCVSKICFNSNGDQLAGILHDSEESRIKIWDIPSRNILHSILCDAIPFHIMYTDSHENVLCANHQKTSDKTYTTMLKINKKDYQDLGSAPLLWDFFTIEKRIVQKKNYCGSRYHHLFSDKKLLVIKSNCHEMYLCNQSVPKANDMHSLNSIKASNPYQELTPYEKGKINEALEDRKKYLPETK